MAKKLLAPGGFPFVSNAEFDAMGKTQAQPQAIETPWDEPLPDSDGDPFGIDSSGVTDSAGLDSGDSDSGDLLPLEPQDSFVATPASRVEAPALVAPAPMNQSIPEFKSGTVQHYLMSVDVDQRPAAALVQATRKLLTVSAHQDEAIAVILAAAKHVQSIEGFSGAQQARAPGLHLRHRWCR